MVPANLQLRSSMQRSTNTNDASWVTLTPMMMMMRTTTKTTKIFPFPWKSSMDQSRWYCMIEGLTSDQRELEVLASFQGWFPSYCSSPSRKFLTVSWCPLRILWSRHPALFRRPRTRRTPKVRLEEDRQLPSFTKIQGHLSTSTSKELLEEVSEDDRSFFFFSFLVRAKNFISLAVICTSGRYGLQIDSCCTTASRRLK